MCSPLFIFAIVAFALMSNPSLFAILRVRKRIEGLFPFFFFLHLKNIDDALLENLPANAGDTRHKSFIPGVKKIPWGRKWQPTAVFLPRNSHGERSLAAPVHGVAKSQTALSTHT